MTYRRIRLGKLGNDPAVDFAVQELTKYLKQMDGELTVDVLCADKVQPAFQNIIWVGLDDAFANQVAAVKDAEVDDAVAIHVENGSGFITGSNTYSVLLAAYRFLKELGCDWLRPGVAGERIPQKPLDNVCVSVSEAASYRHRGICIEGANTYENILDMIDFIPKVGMNTYFVQFIVPGEFFERWYKHEGNPLLKPEDISLEEIAAMVVQLEQEIAKRGIRYHKTGHGWTCEPFGIDGTSWDSTKQYPIADEVQSYLAQVNGKRELWGNVPLNTNLCYSNPTVRGKMTDAITEYCQKNPHVDVLHFWLADGSNNHCECAECVKKRPADWYVMMLNELDAKLTAAGVDTKIVFLIYVDLLWEPETEHLENPDRFVLMFAPITRNYGQNYTDHLSYDEKLPAYVRNQLTMPKSLAQNLEHLRHWQASFQGDSFIFDYHLMWAHVNDPGYEACARNLFEDMRSLHVLGLNGMVSCQIQRCFFPTAMPVYMMAAALWDKDCSYDVVAKHYYEASFGIDGQAVQAYLQGISDALSVYNGPSHSISKENKGPFCKDYAALKTMLSEFMPTIAKNLQLSGPQKRDWEILQLHSAYMSLLIRFLEDVENGTQDAVATDAQALQDWLNTNELKLQKECDGWLVQGMWKTYAERLGQ